jgi:hypothetical protein
MTKHFVLRFALPTVVLCSALSACVIRTSGTYDDCEIDPQSCGGGAIACFIDRDCPTGLICDRGNSTCVPSSTCYAGQVCPRYYHCDERATCVPDDRTGSTGGRGGAGGSASGGASGTGSGGRMGSGGVGVGSGGAPGMTGSGGAPGSGGHGTGGAAQPGTGGAAGAGPACTPA